MAGHFTSPKLWLAQAREDLHDFNRRERVTLSKSNTYTPFEDLDRRPGFKVVGVKVTDVPETLSTKATQIVTSLRSALDQATWQASILLGAKEKERIYFPIAKSKQSFEDMFKGKGSAMNIPSQLHPSLKALGGFPGGNDLLYALSAISNPGKHTKTYRVGVEISEMDFGGFGDIVEAAMPPRFDAERKEFVFYVTTISGGFNHKIEIVPHVVFADAPIVKDRSVAHVLDQMVGMANGIVSGIEAESDKIRGQSKP